MKGHRPHGDRGQEPCPGCIDYWTAQGRKLGLRAAAKSATQASKAYQEPHELMTKSALLNLADDLRKLARAYR